MGRIGLNGGSVLQAKSRRRMHRRLDDADSGMMMMTKVAVVGGIRSVKDVSLLMIFIRLSFE